MCLGSCERLLGDDQSMGETYCLILTTHLLATSQLVAMDIGSGGAGVCDVAPDLGIGWVFVYHGFGLGAGGQQRPRRSDGTYLKNAKNPVEFQHPGSSRLFVVPAEKSSERIPFIPLDNVHLDLVHSPTVGSLVNESHGICIAIQLTSSIARSPRRWTD